MYLVWAGSQDTYTRYVGTYVPGLHPPPKIEQKACWWNCSKKTKYFEVKNNLNTELTEMGVFSAVAGNQLPNQLQKRVLPALFHLITPTFSPWTHTSNDSYIYQLSLVLATATVSFTLNIIILGHYICASCVFYHSLYLSRRKNRHGHWVCLMSTGT